MKECFKCGARKPLSELYRHSAMKDGHLGKCKECTRNDVRINYASRREKYARYDHERQQTPERRANKAKHHRTHNERHPDRRTARSKAARLPGQPCQECGAAKAQRHHDDYSRPLDVRWLCFKCHREKAHGQVVTVQASF